MKSYKIIFISHNQPILIGRFMLIFSRRRIKVTNYFFNKINDEDGEFSILFDAEEWAAQNLLKQIQKQIDIFDASLIEI